MVPRCIALLSQNQCGYNFPFPGMFFTTDKTCHDLNSSNNMNTKQSKLTKPHHHAEQREKNVLKSVLGLRKSIKLRAGISTVKKVGSHFRYIKA
jgi:hypothetical protein